MLICAGSCEVFRPAELDCGGLLLQHACVMQACRYRRRSLSISAALNVIDLPSHNGLCWC